MTITVKLDDIIEGMECQSDENHSYLDKRTGTVVSISDEEIQAAEDNEPIEDFPEWQQDLIKIAKEILQETSDCVGLPSKFDIDEYSIMERFCLSIDDPEISDTLYSLIKGSGVFRRFKDALYEYNLSDDWYKYRDKRLKEIAVEWCEANGIEFEEK